MFALCGFCFYIAYGSRIAATIEDVTIQKIKIALSGQSGNLHQIKAYSAMLIITSVAYLVDFVFGVIIFNNIKIRSPVSTSWSGTFWKGGKGNFFYIHSPKISTNSNIMPYNGFKTLPLVFWYWWLFSTMIFYNSKMYIVLTDIFHSIKYSFPYIL